MSVKGLFNDGAMVNALCKMVYSSLQNVLVPTTIVTHTLYDRWNTHTISRKMGRQHQPEVPGS